MVYFYTSGNVKMLRNIILDYNSTSDITPYEYMKAYVDKCPEFMEGVKVTWIADTFLDIQKHCEFLKNIASHLSEYLSECEQDYFMILFHAVTFQLDSKDMPLLYKCMFNLSKPLLSTFTNFLGNNEVLTFIAQVAQASYDTNYITDKIIGPLFDWQPYISEMGHSYGQYVKKTESRRIKPLTIPVHPNVLNRKSKETPTVSITESLPPTPANTEQGKIKKKMLTKNVIDQRLKQIHDKNKHKAAFLLNDVKNKNQHYTQTKSEKYYKTIANIKDELENQFIKPLPKQRQTFEIKHHVPVKDTAASVMRIKKNIQLEEQKQIMWMENILVNCSNTLQVDDLEKNIREQIEREQMLEIERKHLEGQISYEEALIAKKKHIENNKKKYEEFLKEKQTWNKEIENWRKLEIEKNRRSVEKLSMIELNLVEAKNSVITKRKESADNMKKQSEKLLAELMKKKHEELERKIQIIKEIKVLADVAKKSKCPKVIDLTESSGLGFLCEMSIAELQERMSLMKINLRDEIERKRNQIKEENSIAKLELENTKTSIKLFLDERASIKKQNKQTSELLKVKNLPPSKEITDLKKVLEEKRKQRLELSI